MMKTRSPFRLQKLLFVWNVGLALFSILFSLRMATIIIHRLQEYGVYNTLCYPGAAEHKKVASIWAYWFIMSKAVELGDTVFIVLRKKPLLIVHWYHHTSVLVYTWNSSIYPSSIYLFFGIANSFVHACMYTYLALKVLKVPIPKQTGMIVTILELIQLVTGLKVI